MKNYMKPTIFIFTLDAEDIITSSTNWQESVVQENEDIWEDFYK